MELGGRLENLKCFKIKKNSNFQIQIFKSALLHACPKYHIPGRREEWNLSHPNGHSTLIVAHARVQPLVFVAIPVTDSGNFPNVLQGVGGVDVVRM